MLLLLFQKSYLLAGDRAGEFDPLPSPPLLGTGLNCSDLALFSSCLVSSKVCCWCCWAASEAASISIRGRFKFLHRLAYITGRLQETARVSETRVELMVVIIF